MLFPSGGVKENPLYSRLLALPQPLLFTNPSLPSLYLDLRENFFSYENTFSKTFHLGPHEEKDKILLAGESTDKEVWQIQISQEEAVFWYKQRKHRDFHLVVLSPHLAKRRRKLLFVKRKAALEKNLCLLK